MYDTFEVARPARTVHRMNRSLCRVRERLSELEHERLLKIKELEPLDAEQLETVPGAVKVLDEVPICE
jgi:hypothetical protein